MDTRTNYIERNTIRKIVKEKEKRVMLEDNFPAPAQKTKMNYAAYDPKLDLYIKRFLATKDEGFLIIE